MNKKIIVDTCPNDENRSYLTASKLRKCPYCDEYITDTQVTYKIVKTKPTTRWDSVKPYTVIKRLKDACGWNCSRKVIDKLNAERTEEEIDRGIEYRRD